MQCAFIQQAGHSTLYAFVCVALADILQQQEVCPQRWSTVSSLRCHALHPAKSRRRCFRYHLDGLWHRPAQDITGLYACARMCQILFSDILNMYGSQLHVMRITALSATEYQEEELLQVMPEPDSLWGSRRLHHMDIIAYSGGTSAPATGNLMAVRLDAWLGS